MGIRALIKLINTWFLSDLDIEFELKRNRKKLLCLFESNVWYEHINDPKRGITIKSIRHKGDKRSFIVVDGDDHLFEEVKGYCYQEYDLKQTLNVARELASNFRIA
jgi:hypothetical protein